MIGESSASRSVQNTALSWLSSSVPARNAVLRSLHDAADSFVRRPPVIVTAALLVAGTVFVLVTAKSLPLIGGLVAVLAIGCVAPWVAMAGVRGRLGFDRPRCHVGESVEAWIDLASGVGARRALMVVTDGSSRIACTTQSAPTRLTMTPLERGLFPRVPPCVESNAPFGMVTARRPLRVETPLIVWPVISAIRFPAAVAAPRRHGRESSDGVPGSSGDVLGVRDYRAGDSARSIHWAQTARRDVVMVCERPGDGGPTVQLLLDRDATMAMATAAERRAALDAIVSLAASMLASWVPRGVRVEMAWDGDTVYRPRDRRGLEQAIDAVACLEPRGGVPPAAAGNVTAGNGGVAGVVPTVRLPRLRPADLVIWLTTPARPREFTGDGQRIVIVVEPAIERPAHTPLRPRRADRRGSLEIVLPTSDAAAHLDRIFTEMGHDPDASRG
jgi:uncharacterized protein (DUF58 family)